MANESPEFPTHGELPDGTIVELATAEAMLSPAQLEELTVTMPDGTKVRPFRCVGDGDDAYEDEDGNLVLG